MTTNGNGTPIDPSTAASEGIAFGKPKRGRVGRKMKRFVVLEEVATFEAESEEVARERLPQGRVFVLAEVVDGK